MPEISIITATFNAAKVIDRLFESIKNQTSKDFEFIIIDGGSKDNTLDKVKGFEEYISYWISEKDKGIYDAWNKGIRKATGNWIMFLGADDFLMPDSIKKYIEFLSKCPNREEILYLSSRMEMVDETGKSIRIKGWPWRWPEFLKEMMVAHPGSLHSKKLFQQYGLFDSNYRSSGDFELLTRPKDNLNAAFMDEITVRMQEGGMSDSWIGIKEHRTAAIKTGGYPPVLAYKNAYWVYFKFLVRKSLRRLGINAYLKK